MIKIHISKCGIVVGEMELPKPMDEIRRQLETFRQPGDMLYVFSVDSPVAQLSWHLQHTGLNSDATLQKLNQLAETIDGMNAVGHYHLSRDLSTDSRQSLSDVYQIAAHIKPSSMDCYEIIPEVTSYQELGKWLVEHDRLEKNVPKILYPYLNYHNIGVDFCNDHDGELLSSGYVGIRTGAMEQHPEEQGILHITLTTPQSTFPLSLPAMEDRFEQAKRALGIEDFSQAVISGVEYAAPYLNRLIPTDCITVEDANEMAICLQRLKTDGETMKYCAALEVEEPSTFTEALDLAIDIDDYELISDSEREYGREALRRLGADGELLDTIDGYTDFDQLGRAMMEEDGVRQTGYGLVRRLSKPFPPEPEIGQTLM